MFYLSKLKNKNLSDETCLLRVDFNVEGAKDALRLEAVIPTIKFLIGQGAKVVLASHRGRPPIRGLTRLPAGRQGLGRGPTQTEIKGLKKKFGLSFAARFLAKKLKKKVVFFDDLDWRRIKKTIAKASPSSLFMLENLRFFKEEERNNKQFAKKLASLGTFYVNDAFAVSHRKNASVAAITKFMPSYAGLLLEKEMTNLDKAAKNPKKPLILILGGAKISDKIGLIKKFIKKAKYILIGGGVANTILAARGVDIDGSLYEPRMLGFAKKLLRHKNIILPTDWISSNHKILDIGPLTVEKFAGIIKKAKTIVWNGPLGYFEDKRFRNGSDAIAKIISRSKAFSVIGGGETTTLVKSLKLKVKSSKMLLSTGGGAMLEYLIGKKLPGLEALKTHYLAIYSKL